MLRFDISPAQFEKQRAANPLCEAEKGGQRRHPTTLQPGTQQKIAHLLQILPDVREIPGPYRHPRAQDEIVRFAKAMRVDSFRERLSY